MATTPAADRPSEGTPRPVEVSSTAPPPEVAATTLAPDDPGAASRAEADAPAAAAAATLAPEPPAEATIEVAPPSSPPIETFREQHTDAAAPPVAAASPPPVAEPRAAPGPVPLGMPPDAASLLGTAPEAVDPASYPPARFARDLPRVMAIANQKGGVGKTTTAVNLGAGLAELGYRVLVIDLDPQGNATTGLGINPRNLESSIYDVMMHDVPLDDCIEPTSLRNLFVCPATIDLAGAEIELVPAFSRELKLRRALEPVLEDFDFVVIDCPPSLGLITVNALAAATEVVVPIQCEYYALEGLGQLLRNVKLVQTNLNPRLEVSAIVLTMFDARTKLADQVATEVRNHFGPKVCRNIVPRTVRLSEAPSFGQPIVVFDPTSRGAIAYRELAKEVSGGAPQRVG
ncbi:MAG: ParA family protein [Acidimicrobiales bacterium]